MKRESVTALVRHPTPYSLRDPGKFLDLPEAPLPPARHELASTTTSGLNEDKMSTYL